MLEPQLSTTKRGSEIRCGILAKVASHQTFTSIRVRVAVDWLYQLSVACFLSPFSRQYANCVSFWEKVFVSACLTATSWRAHKQRLVLIPMKQDFVSILKSLHPRFCGESPQHTSVVKSICWCVTHRPIQSCTTDFIWFVIFLFLLFSFLFYTKHVIGRRVNETTQGEWHHRPSWFIV